MGNNLSENESYIQLPKVSFSQAWTHQQSKNDRLYGDIKIYTSCKGSNK